MSSGNTFDKFFNTVSSTLEYPVEWFRKSIVVPNQQDYPWYHRQFRRVPTIDQCYTDDIGCFFEANEQFKRDKLVDDEIINILRRRKENCYMHEEMDRESKCAQLTEDFEQACGDHFTKYGDLGAYKNVKKAYMKQKHRMIWERRYGPVGTGMTPREERVEA